MKQIKTIDNIVNSFLSQQKHTLDEKNMLKSKSM